MSKSAVLAIFCVVAVVAAAFWLAGGAGLAAGAAGYKRGTVSGSGRGEAAVQAPVQSVAQAAARVAAPEPSAEMEVQAWVYPGSPGCDARAEYADGRSIQVLKPEYFTINERGTLVLIQDGGATCNGYSAENVAHIKRYSREQYVTVSSASAESMATFLERSLENSADVDALASFVVSNGLTGIELDFEDFGSWTGEEYKNYKAFVSALGTKLRGKGKKLIIDGPAISSATEQAWFAWRYEDFVKLPVDRIVVMAYDYQFDHGAGSPVAPLDWIQRVGRWTLSKYPYPDRITMGIPSYGYRGVKGTHSVRILTYDQIAREPGFSKASRHRASQEMTWTSGSNVYFFQDAVSMREKLRVIRGLGIQSVSVWHLGGNKWLTD